MGRRRPWLTILALALLAAGLGVLFYPKAMDIKYDSGTASLKKEFLQNPGVDYSALYAFLKAENERLFQTGQNGLADAFSYEQPSVNLSAYGIQDNIIGFVSLPSIGIELPIYLGANPKNMMKGAVHLTETSYPIGGPNTNSVVAAHRGQTVKQFREIHKLQVGDEIIVTNFRETLVYQVIYYKIIQPDETGEILIQPGRELLSLFSCHPLGDNTPRNQRYLVVCERVG
ncbi:MAG: class C sortase [Oscillospiraceae bacterium]|nr:class C sortase [Oscillospiraceae bacterium]